MVALGNPYGASREALAERRRDGAPSPKLQGTTPRAAYMGVAPSQWAELF